MCFCKDLDYFFNFISNQQPEIVSPLHYLLCIHPPRPVRSLSSLLALPLPCHIPSQYKYTHTSQPELFFLHLPRKMEPIECSETSAFKPQTPGKYPKENILQPEIVFSSVLILQFACWDVQKHRTVVRVAT